jgi:hypothetical protein
VELCFANQELVGELLQIVADIKTPETAVTCIWGRHFKRRETILSVNTNDELVQNGIVKS